MCRMARRRGDSLPIPPSPSVLQESQKSGGTLSSRRKRLPCSLSATSTDEAAAELTRLHEAVKFPSKKKLIDKSLDRAAELSGQTREDLEESTVPTYGLDAEGCLKQTFEDFTAECYVTGREGPRLLWRKADGSLQKSVPAEVKHKHAAQLKALKRTIQAIEKMRSAQRERIERLLHYDREWGIERWQERYLTHPLLANFGRRLIWSFHQNHQAAAGIWHDGKIVDYQDCPLDWLSAKTRVRLWHPLGKELEVVAGWRRWLETHLVTQPFKQAHREYLHFDGCRKTNWPLFEPFCWAHNPATSIRRARQTARLDFRYARGVGVRRHKDTNLVFA